MTVNKIGRPSKAHERRAEILHATMRVAGRDGLAGVTVASVAQEAGMQRTLVFHYFRDRPSLLRAFIEHTVGAYGEAQLLSGGGRIETRVERAFELGFYAEPEDLAVWQELVALSARDAGVRRQLRSLWTERWLGHAERELALARPQAKPRAVAEVAYGLACLVEAHWAFHAQGLADATRTAQAKRAARALLATLP